MFNICLAFFLGLLSAMDRRHLKDLEKAVANAKRSGFELVLSNELIEAHKLIIQLRRLERIRAEILELKQSTVAEIRSYQKPPPIVHQVMTATFLLLKHHENETAVSIHKIMQSYHLSFSEKKMLILRKS